ncbi:hypothetical protein WJX77_010415 [Trebouxia sp. C0004]
MHTLPIYSPFSVLARTLPYAPREAWHLQLVRIRHGRAGFAGAIPCRLAKTLSAVTNGRKVSEDAGCRTF